VSATRYPNGITNVAAGKAMGEFGLPDPSIWSVYYNDFIKPTDYSTSDWTITTVEAGGGSATEAIQNADHGILLLTNDAADNDADSLQLSKETFKFVPGKKLFFKTRLKVSDATQSDWLIGIVITDTTPLVNTDGVYFQKDDGDANIDFHVNKNSTSTDATGIHTNVDDTYVELGFAYLPKKDGTYEVVYFVDGSRKGALASTNLPDDEELTVTINITNGEAVAKTMSIDYILVASER